MEIHKELIRDLIELASLTVTYIALLIKQYSYVLINSTNDIKPDCEASLFKLKSQLEKCGLEIILKINLEDANALKNAFAGELVATISAYLFAKYTEIYVKYFRFFYALFLLLRPSAPPESEGNRQANLKMKNSIKCELSELSLQINIPEEILKTCMNAPADGLIALKRFFN